MIYFKYYFEAFLSFASVYFFSVNTFYAILFFLALFSIRKRTRLKPLLKQMNTLGFSPPVTIVVPAYNEQLSIVQSVKSLFRLRYGQLEVVVINDGSKDNTLELLKTSCMLVPDETVRLSNISSSSVRGTYRSQIHPNLIVIDKENSGKADSLNVGMDYASNDLICAVDSDSVLDDEALLAIAVPFIEDPKTIASGGTIQIANGSTIRNSRVLDTKMPGSWIERVQIVEYIRSFFCGRVGLDSLNSTLVISGAFGIFKKEAVQAVDGYKTSSLGEDMDLVVRLHRHYRENDKQYSIVFLPDPVCYTEAPSDLKTLFKQRKRWQVGLLQSLYQNKDMMLNRRYGIIGMFAFPYNFVVDVLGPLIEVVAYLTLILGACFGLISTAHIVQFTLVSLLYGMIISVGAVVIGELYYHRYNRLRDILLLLAATVVENLGYRQLNSLWRIRAFWDFVRGDTRWGRMERKGF
jgi:Glycosyltransferases, probably involved in cell wall biogenesis